MNFIDAYLKQASAKILIWKFWRLNWEEHFSVFFLVLTHYRKSCMESSVCDRSDRLLQEEQDEDGAWKREKEDYLGRNCKRRICDKWSAFHLFTGTPGRLLPLICLSSSVVACTNFSKAVTCT